MVPQLSNKLKPQASALSGVESDALQPSAFYASYAACSAEPSSRLVGGSPAAGNESCPQPQVRADAQAKQMHMHG